MAQINLQNCSEQELTAFFNAHDAQDYCLILNCPCHTDTGYHTAVTDKLISLDGNAEQILTSFTTADPADEDNVFVIQESRGGSR